MKRLRLCKVLGSCAAALVGTVVAPPLSAQSSELRVGDVARVSATKPALHRLVGRIVQLTADTLALQTDDSVARIAIERSALTSAERRLYNASRMNHVLAGAGLGLLGGAAIGGIAGALGSGSCSPYADGPCGPGFGAALGILAGGALGLIAGTTVGLLRPVERWSRVNNFGVSVAPTGAVTRPGVVVALRF